MHPASRQKPYDLSVGGCFCVYIMVVFVVMVCALNSKLGRCVYEETKQYLNCLQGSSVTGVYQMVIQEVERSLLRLVMEYTGNNQSEAAKTLGLSRGTLRKKLAQYELL